MNRAEIYATGLIVLLVGIAAIALARRLRRGRPRPLDEATIALEYLPMWEIRRSRLRVYARRDQLGGDTPETVVVAGYYFGTDEFHAVANVPFLALSAWEAGRLAIQDAFPTMPFADRVFIGTGNKHVEYSGD